MRNFQGPGGGDGSSGGGLPVGWMPSTDAGEGSGGGGEGTGDSDVGTDGDDGAVDSLVRMAFDLLPTQVAVLDGEGTILHTNRTWEAFGSANDLEGPSDSVGVDYLEVCAGADDEHAARAASGIRSVLADGTDPFSMEYPCHGPDERRWFVMWARGFERDGERYAVVVHLDVTARKLSELAVERRNAELEAVERIGELVREIVASLGRATTRTDVERAVCDRLTTDAAYAAAAIVDPTATDGLFTVRERSVADEDGDAPTDAVADDRTTGVVEAALEAGETRVVRETSAPVSTGDVRDPAIVAVPLRHRGAVHGVLVVTGRRPDAFDEREAAAFDVLGESAGFAVHAVETERFLHADETLELRFRLREDTLPFFSTLGASTEDGVEFDDVVPGGDGTVVVYASVHGVTAEAVESRAAAHDAIESVRVIDDGDGEAPARLELRYQPPSPVHDVVTAGGVVRACTVAADGGLLVVDVDDAATMRTVVDAVAGEADLVGKRGRGERNGGRSDEVALEVGLTDRQRDALVAAHRGGYYEWPRRESTAEDLAAAMGVAPQTLHEHLRRAEGKVVDRFVEVGLARRRPDPE